MGLNHIAIAAVIALLGAASALHAEETATSPANPAADTTTATPAPSDDPALKASPIAGSTPSAPPAGAAESVTPATSETTPASTPEMEAPAKTKGDTLTIPKKAPAVKKKKVSSAPAGIVVDGMPGRGASMAQVEKHFGEPRQKVAPVGNPPITRWIYSDYTVYFEYEYVIHSVRNDGTTAQPAARPATTKPMPQKPAAPASESAPVPAGPATQSETPAMQEMAAPPVEATPPSGQ